eukprot:CAMPEP_0115281792 /NCGR_PEP_ID=MMETSP0270-20121206/59506_1 /TAXON_ID=71861 /ORGANISM="Scrippsiella trochoidea, Strain CCMP3099" /LENGTH=256 /DNA_ID=CAMNT_0002698611 /DNA_START=159 /DNA_END=929 /DNA_ORIENTATION=-
MATSPSVAALLSDLRGVTVRNTFLEFEDTAPDDLPDSGFARQASEPAKPFNRQVSEQTTTGSGATLEENSTEPEDAGLSQLASYLTGVPLPGGGGGTRPHGAQMPDLATAAALQAVMQVAAANSASGGAPAAPAAPAPPSVAGMMPPVMRFCPNCGAEAEPNHRFCPYCCYQLQQPFPGGGGTVGSGNRAPAAPLRQRSCSQQAFGEDRGANASTSNPGAPNLLTCLRRFRYVEARPADVEYAHALCVNFACGLKA